MIVDATGLVLGRLASVAAKSLLAGEEVKIVNAEKALITGSRDFIFEDYGHTRARGHKEKGPYFPRRPEMILKRTVRGMLPYKRTVGSDAFRRVRVYVGIPVEFVGSEREVLEDAHMNRLNNPKFVTVGAVSTFLGAKY